MGRYELKRIDRGIIYIPVEDDASDFGFLLMHT